MGTDIPVIKIRGLEKTFPTFHLGPLDLTVPEGAIYGLVGANGAGKTTTIDLIMGMGAKDAGTIEVFGLDHAREEVAVKKQIGYVSPDLAFNAWGKVGRAIGFISSFYNDWDTAYCDELVKRLNIGYDDRIATLSFGARTKLNLVMALAHRPRLLLLDEPLVGLDAVSKHEVFTELLRAVENERRTVLISSHNLDDLERFADHIGIIHRGKLLLEGPTSHLINRFRVIDCTHANGATVTGLPGIYAHKNDHGRWRLLIDTQTLNPDHLAQHGFTSITATPVTLEELFVQLVKGL